MTFTDRMLLLLEVLHMVVNVLDGQPAGECPEFGPVCYHNTSVITNTSFQKVVSYTYIHTTYLMTTICNLYVRLLATALSSLYIQHTKPLNYNTI